MSDSRKSIRAGGEDTAASPSVPHYSLDILGLTDQPEDTVDAMQYSVLVDGERIVYSDQGYIASGEVLEATVGISYGDWEDLPPDRDGDQATCAEQWTDRAGCLPGRATHECMRTGVHATHRCDCGALVIDDQQRSSVENVRETVRAQYGHHQLLHAADGGCRQCPLAAGDPIHLIGGER